MNVTVIYIYVYIKYAVNVPNESSKNASSELSRLGTTSVLGFLDMCNFT